jgi:ankyrin repeat protein
MDSTGMQLVQMLLEKCQADGVAWEDPALYGDSWTPLMCCVVGNRVSLAETLLAAAGPRMPALLRARNRHGQTALHLAAYRGASDMIKLLMRFSEELGADEGKGGGVVRARDAAGLTPAQVAHKHSQCAAEALLLRRIGTQA